MYVPESDFIISPTEEERTASCNTLKSHGAKFCKSTCGILVGAFPCGIIPLFEELYGVESISQVYGILTDWIGETEPRSLQYLLYDDGCHLAPFSKEPKRASFSTASKTAASLEYYIDKMHFKGHVSKTCHERYNPYSCLALTKVNTQICEQGFNFFNKFTQVKAMNEFRFRLFFTYIIDLHNLKFTNRLHESHPNTTPHPSKVHQDEGVIAAFNDLTLKDRDTDEDPVKNEISCHLCGKKDFGKKNPKSGLTRHLKTIHKDVELEPEGMFKCDQCGKVVKSRSGLTRHKKSHKDFL